MGYLDELRALFEQGHDDECGEDGCEVLRPTVDVLGDAPFDIARAQLTEGTTGYHEGPEGTFRACGAHYGCGYAEACVVVDPETGVADVDINSHLAIPRERRGGARKLFRKLNKTFILPGLTVGDDGCMHFVPQAPCNLRSGDDLAEWLGKGFTTVHRNARLVTELQAGRSGWDVWRAMREEDEAPANPLAALLG